MMFIQACSNDEIALNESFFKIYDDFNIDKSYRPIDVVETIDGYIILTGTELNNTDFMGVQLMKVDSEGNFELENTLDNYVVPVGDLYLNVSDSNVFFFAMNPTSLEAVLLAVNPNLEIEQETLLGGLNYPLSAALTSNGNFLLQSYDPISQEIELSEIGLNGSLINSAQYSIGPGDDVESEIIDHYLNATDRPLPFFCGEYGSGSYYFNGFYNYTFSLVFTDFSTTPSGVVQGQGSNAGLRAILPLAGSEFAIAGFQFDNNFHLSSVGLSTTGISSSVDLFPENISEIKPYAPAKIISYAGSGADYVIFATETKGNQIVLSFYNANTNLITGVHRVGYLNPFTFSSIKIGSDNSILLLGTTFVAGRFERVVLNKISASEISDFLN